MKINKDEKAFDAVKMMREVRDKISQETQNMSLEELKVYVKKKLTDNNAKIIGKA